MDFVTGLPISTNWKGNSYNSILVFVNQPTKIVYYELVETIIDATKMAKVIIDVIVRYHDLPNSIVSDKNSVFISKF